MSAIVTFPTFSLLIIIFVFSIFTLNPFNSNASFQASSLHYCPSSVSLTNVRLSGQSNYSEHPDLISLDSVSSTMINNKGLNTEPSYNRIWSIKSTLNVQFTLTRLWAFLYIDCTVLTNHSSTLRFLKAHHTTFPDTQSKAFSKSTNSKHKFLFFAKYFSCNFLKIKMAFVVPHSRINQTASHQCPHVVNNL